MRSFIYFNYLIYNTQKWGNVSQENKHQRNQNTFSQQSLTVHPVTSKKALKSNYIKSRG